MKATGIVRRIDDLGRVVIPKEIRRTMRIREGDPSQLPFLQVAMKRLNPYTSATFTAKTAFIASSTALPAPRSKASSAASLLLPVSLSKSQTTVFVHSPSRKSNI